MTAKKTTDKTNTTESTETGLIISEPDSTSVVTNRNNNDSDPTGVNPAATWETSPTPSLAVDPDFGTDTNQTVAEVRHPIQCLAPMPCNCPACTGTGTDDNTLSAEEAVAATDALVPVQTEEEAAAGAKAADKTSADEKAAADKAAK